MRQFESSSHDSDCGCGCSHPNHLKGCVAIPREEYERLTAENARLSALINNPHMDDFMAAVKLEAAHQRERWGTEKDAAKDDSDWFWLVGYLTGKALSSGVLHMNAREQDEQRKHHEKRLHHIITSAAALLNWHAYATGAVKAEAAK
jgi:hypothetical protein